MKKMIAMLISLVLVLSCAACAKKEVQSIGTPAVPDNAVTMQATILEIDNGKMLVEPVEGSAELRSADKFSVPMEHMDASPEPQVGYLVEITYDGNISETYPAMLDTVYFVEVIEESMSSDCKAFNPEGVKIGIDKVTYVCTGKEMPIEPEESAIEYVEIPVGGDHSGMITAFAKMHEDNKDYLVCLIDGEWYEFLAENE